MGNCSNYKALGKLDTTWPLGTGRNRPFFMNKRLACPFVFVGWLVDFCLLRLVLNILLEGTQVALALEGAWSILSRYNTHALPVAIVSSYIRVARENKYQQSCQQRNKKTMTRYRFCTQHFADVLPFHRRTLPSSPDDDKIVPVTFHSTRQTYYQCKVYSFRCDSSMAREDPRMSDIKIITSAL